MKEDAHADTILLQFLLKQRQRMRKREIVIEMCPTKSSQGGRITCLSTLYTRGICLSVGLNFLF